MTATHITADLGASWSAADRPAIDFVQYAGDALPGSSFCIRPNETVVDVARFFRRLGDDLAAGPGSPCAESALSDCRALQASYGRAGKPGRQEYRLV
jgi:hypothetical protein